MTAAEDVAREARPIGHGDAVLRKVVLALDGAGDRIGALVWSEGATLGAAEAAVERGRGERLIDLADAALARAGLVYRDLERIVVLRGPGSFTGVRVGVAAARGLALGLGRPAVGVDGFTLAAAAEGGEAPPRPGPAIAVFGQGAAFQWRVFAAVEAAPRAVGEIGGGDLAALEAAATAVGAVCAVGPAAAALAGRLPVAGGGRLSLRSLARLGAAVSLDGGVERARPLYARPPDATPPATPPLRRAAD